MVNPPKNEPSVKCPQCGSEIKLNQPSDAGT